jgi:hypothetical protein
MTVKEERIEQVRNKIAESKKDLESYSDTLPVVILFVLGVVILFYALVFARNLFQTPRIIIGVVGFVIILLAFGVSLKNRGEEKKLKDQIFQYEGELYNLEKEP